MQGALKGCQDSLVRLPEKRRIHREVYLVLVVLIWIEEDPAATQGRKEGCNVYMWVEFNREDVGAVRESSHSDALALVEAVNKRSPFGHCGAKTLHKPLGASQGQRCCQARRRQSATEHAPLMIESIKARVCPCQDGSKWGTEILVEGDIHRVEVRRILLGADAGRSGHHIQPRPVQMGRDAPHRTVVGDHHHLGV